MHSFKRAERVRELMLHEIAAIIRDEVKDPDIGFITVTAVDLTDNLQMARVYVSPLGSDEEIRKSFKGIKRARKFIKAALAKRMRIKYMPDIDFKLDRSGKEADKINRLLHKIHDEERPMGSPEGDE